MTFVPLTQDERASMLATLGLGSTEALFDVIPEMSASRRSTSALPSPRWRQWPRWKRWRPRTDPVSGIPFFLGAGAYRHFIPSAVGALMSRSEFSTSYTPYQPEVSQGTLQMSFEFQSLICDLTAMDVTNASVYDGASAVAEGALMALRLTGRDRIVVSAGVHPHYRQALEYVRRGRGDVDVARARCACGTACSTKMACSRRSTTGRPAASSASRRSSARSVISSRPFDAAHAAGALVWRSTTRRHSVSSPAR